MRIPALILTLTLATLPAQAISRHDQEQAGATLFRDKGCAYCHGPATAGTAKGPSLLNIRKTMPAPKITDQIKNGGQKMPAFGDSLSDEEIANLVAWLRAKHRPNPTSPTTSAPVSNPAQ